MTGTAMQVLSVASELAPLVKTGGLADVAGALPRALAAENVTVRTLVPGYPAVLAALTDAASVLEDGAFLSGQARLLAGRAAGLDLFVLDAPALYGRAGTPYGEGGRDFDDNPLRFASLAHAAARLAWGEVAAWRPDCVHAHDWQAALLPAYLHYADRPRPGTVLTIHNLAFQGQVPAALLGAFRLPQHAYTPDGVEYYGAIGFLAAGIRFADRITTVSPSYADDILTPEGGMGMDGVLRARADRVEGILNGLDTDTWSPDTDPHLVKTYRRKTLDNRFANKVALRARVGLAQTDTLLFGVISRLTEQKGMDLLAACLPDALPEDAQLVLLGAGNPALETAFRAHAAHDPGRIACVVGYDEALAHMIQGGADALLVPSRFEPCGLTQLAALRYGCVPVVARVGGLADSIIDANEAALRAEVATGLQFSPVTETSLRGAMTRAQRLHDRPGTWKRMQKNGMDQEVGWERAARRYAVLYRESTARG